MAVPRGARKKALLAALLLCVTLTKINYYY